VGARAAGREVGLPLARDGKTNRAGAPRNPLLLALVLRHFEDEICIVWPPRFVQRIVFGVLASIEQLLGYRAVYPYPYARQSAAYRSATQPGAARGSSQRTRGSDQPPRDERWAERPEEWNRDPGQTDQRSARRMAVTKPGLLAPSE
jgi:hypothetical protein